MTLDVALTIASKRDVELWPMCVAGSAGWSPDSLRETALDILTTEVLRLQAELATAEAELQEHRRIAGELDVLLGSGCNAAQPELVEQLQQHLAIAEAAVGPSALDTLAREVRRLQGEVDYLTNAGVIECAIRNKSVSDYMDHWEGRTLKAEAALATAEAERDTLREQMAEREEAAFMAGWIEGNSEVVHGLTWTYSQESQQRDAAFLRWQARQKGTP
jgi:hypothetical protein